MPALPDDEYDALIIDAERIDDAIRVELVISAGAFKGEVVGVFMRGGERDEIALLGMPATLTVERGAPRITIDD